MSDNGVLVVSEDECRRLVDPDAAFGAVKAVFGRMAREKAKWFSTPR